MAEPGRLVRSGGSLGRGGGLRRAAEGPIRPSLSPLRNSAAFPRRKGTRIHPVARPIPTPRSAGRARLEKPTLPSRRTGVPSAASGRRTARRRVDHQAQARGCVRHPTRARPSADGSSTAQRVPAFRRLPSTPSRLQPPKRRELPAAGQRYAQPSPRASRSGVHPGAAGAPTGPTGPAPETPDRIRRGRLRPPTASARRRTSRPTTA